MRFRTPLLTGVLLIVVSCEKGDSASPTAPAPAASPGDPSEAAPAGLPDRDPKLAWRLVNEQAAVLLDVRSQDEFDEGHLDRAVLIPHDQIADRMQEVVDAAGGDKSKPVVIYCRSGTRAGKAKDALVEAGFTQVTNLGGLTDWPSACDQDAASCAK